MTQKAVQLLTDFIERDLEEKIQEDLLRLRIFNEGDLQYRVASHIENFIKKQKKGNKNSVCLHNLVKIGFKKDKQKVIPDIVICSEEKFPVAAIELKYIVSNQDKFPKKKDTIPPSKFAQVIEVCRKDIEKLERLRDAYGENFYVKVFVVTDLMSSDYIKQMKGLEIMHRKRRKRLVHLINIRDLRTKQGLENWESCRQVFYSLAEI